MITAENAMVAENCRAAKAARMKKVAGFVLKNAALPFLAAAAATAVAAIVAKSVNTD